MTFVWADLRRGTAICLTVCLGLLMIAYTTFTDPNPDFDGGEHSIRCYQDCFPGRVLIALRRLFYRKDSWILGKVSWSRATDHHCEPGNSELIYPVGDRVISGLKD